MRDVLVFDRDTNQEAVIQAKTLIEATRKYMKQNKISGNVKRTSDNGWRFNAIEIQKGEYIDRIKVGVNSWYLWTN